MNKGSSGIGFSKSAVPDEYRTQPPTLADAGIDKKLSARAQKLAALDDSEFEHRVEAAKKQAFSSISMTREEPQAEKRER